jgi:hypothetical protein
MSTHQQRNGYIFMKKELTEQMLSCELLTDSDCDLLDYELHKLETDLVGDYPAVAQFLQRVRMVVDAQR